MYDTYTQLFNSLVLPIIDYGTAVWGNKPSPTLLSIQKNAMRYFLGCTKTMPLVAMTGEMGWLPLQYRLHLNMLKLFLKLENNECNVNLVNVYAWCVSLAVERRKKNWCWSCLKLLSIYRGNDSSLALTHATPSFTQI